MQTRILSALLALVTLVLVGAGIYWWVTRNGKPVAHRPAPDYEVLIRNGTIYDGTGGPPFTGDVAIRGDRVAAIGRLDGTRGRKEIDARGMAIAPGFVNMLSWAGASLLSDPRSLSDIAQGVTLEVMGEGRSMGPLSEQMKRETREQGANFEITWTTLGEYLSHLERRGVATNVASFVGATTLRIHEVGKEDRPPTPAELERMRTLVRQAMQEGALGVGSSLIYAPGAYAQTDELLELAKVAAEYGGMYTSHIRGEGRQLVKSVDELIRIARGAKVRAEIHHLKAAGRSYWDNLDKVISRVKRARAEGLHITANMYTYNAAATGLDAAMPLWVQEGGRAAWIERLKNPEIRKRVIQEMMKPAKERENPFLEAGPQGMLLVGFRTPELRPLVGQTLAEVAKMRKKTPAETAIDLVIENNADIGIVYFLMSEENVRRQIQLPWVSFGSDGTSLAPEGPVLKRKPHPRAYGNFARLLGRYVRDERLIPLEEAIRRLTSLPMENLRIADRGRIAPGFYADVVVFDPETIQDKATYENPHQLATGVLHVFVNGTQVFRNGKHTEATPGRFVRGPGAEAPR